MPSLECELTQGRIPASDIVLSYLKDINPFAGCESKNTAEYHWIPEFYCDAKVLPLAKAISNRQTLESLPNLNEWINSVFPHLPPHPVRRPGVHRPVTIECHSTLSSFETLFAVFKAESVIAVSRSQLTELLLSGQILRVKSFASIETDSVELATYWRNKIAFASYGSAEFVIMDLDNGDRHPVILKDGSISALCASIDFLLVLLKDAQLLIYDENCEFQTVLTYVGGMKCMSYSSGFGLISIGTDSGRVVLSSLSKKRIHNGFSLEEGRKIGKILMTKYWGFIVVVAFEEASEKTWLFSYSAYGEIIQSCEYPREIVAISSLCSSDGFDRVVLADRAGFVFVIDPIVPVIETPVFRSDGEIAGVGLHDQSNVVSIVSRSGVVYYLRVD
jgi:hypothetical protein